MCQPTVPTFRCVYQQASQRVLRAQFHYWYSRQVCNQLDSGSENVEPIDLHLAIVKPLGATWLIALVDYLQLHPEFVINGSQSWAGMVEMLPCL